MIDSSRLRRIALAGIVLVYLLLAVQYARLTPPWQAPDEPAHFNYVKYIAECGALPVLQPGDFPAEYLEQIKARHFPADMSIEPIRYEAWQPPLYYLLVAIPYRLGAAWPLAQQLLALRLLSVVLGALHLLVAYQVAAAFAPKRTWLALGATALVATIPMHIAMTAAVNNDTLAELWVGLVLWQLLLRLRHPDGRLAPWLMLGITLGLAGLTKLSTGALLPLALAVLAYLAREQVPAAERPRFLWPRLLALGLPGFLLMLPWLAHNVSVYGIADPLVFQRHDAVVIGQQRTVEWLSQVGARRAASEFVTTTFHSFWGQFGWMGVLIDERLYRLLAVLSGLAGLGIVIRLARLPRDWRRWDLSQRSGLLLLGGSILLTLLVYLWYNLSFKQHQGRYLFPALIPIAIFLVAGWHEIVRRGWRLPVAAVFALLVIFRVSYHLLARHAWDKWTVAGLAGFGGALGLGAVLSESWSRWLEALPYALLLVLDVICLYLFILPALA